jgi:hypothetical protein
MTKEGVGKKKKRFPTNPILGIPHKFLLGL